MTNKLAKIQNTSIIPSNGEELVKYISDYLVGKKGTGIKSTEEALLVFAKADALNIDRASAIGHMPVVQGKVTLDVHIIKAILSTNSSITWEKIEDFIPVYKMVDLDGTNFASDELPDGYEIISKTLFKKYMEDIKSDPSLHQDKVYVTYRSKSPTDSSRVVVNRKVSYKFTRTFTDPNTKELITRIEISRFSINDAHKAGLIKLDDTTGKIDTTQAWYKYDYLMTDHRAFVFGARAIASDLLFGMLEHKEALDLEQQNYIITEEGDAEVIE